MFISKNEIRDFNRRIDLADYVLEKADKKIAELARLTQKQAEKIFLLCNALGMEIYYPERQPLMAIRKVKRGKQTFWEKHQNDLAEQFRHQAMNACTLPK